MSEAPLVFAYVSPELSAFRTSTKEFSPIRAQFLADELQSFPLFQPPSPQIKRMKLASLADLGQFHTNSYLSTLTQFTESYCPTKKQRVQDEQILSKQLMRDYNVTIEDLEFGALEYCRLVVTGTLLCCDLLQSREVKFAMNPYGGQLQAERNRAHNGAMVNDAVLACLYLLKQDERVLVISMDNVHGFGLEEAFYTSDKVVTMSLHEPNDSGTGKENDIGLGKGENTKFNLPMQDEVQAAGLVRELLPGVIAKFAPQTLIFVVGSSRKQGSLLVCEYLKATKLPVLVLGGTCEDEVQAGETYASVLRALAAKREEGEEEVGLNVQAEEMKARALSRLQ